MASRKGKTAKFSNTAVGRLLLRIRGQAKFSTGQKVLGVLMFLNILATVALTIGAYSGTEPRLPILTDPSFFERYGKSVVMLMDEGETHGGTGFQVRAPSGRAYILTNQHVCEIGRTAGKMVATTSTGAKYHPHILKISETADICLMEPIQGLPALTLDASAPSGTYALVIGHPWLQPLAIEAGVVLGLESYTTSADLSNDEKCNKYGEVEKLEYWATGFKRVCYRTLVSVATSIHIYPGNSGSPVLNLSGRVIGIAYAANSVDHWGAMVPLAEVHNFLIGR